MDWGRPVKVLSRTLYRYTESTYVCLDSTRIEPTFSLYWDKLTPLGFFGRLEVDQAQILESLNAFY